MFKNIFKLIPRKNGKVLTYNLFKLFPLLLDSYRFGNLYSSDLRLVKGDIAPNLFDFSEPGKIDLQAYMDEHYQYNGNLQLFAYLTGRSLSTFKRDFEKIYHTTPNRWLLKKRLEDAHYPLKQKKIKATEVYLEVGFKDYAHFFVAFKKLFGLAPSIV